LASSSIIHSTTRVLLLLQFYLGKASSPAASWDGSDANWFKIAEWGATFDPFSFTDENASKLTTTISPNTPAGEVNS